MSFFIRPPRPRAALQTLWRAGLKTLAALSLVTAVAAPAAAEIDVTHYRLSLDIDPTAQLLTASAEVTLVHDGAPQIVLDLVGLDVAAVTLDGATATFSRGDGTLAIDAPGVTDGTSVTVVVDYSGTPEPYVEVWGSWGIKWEANRVFSVNVTHGARYWFPSHDQVWDKATAEFLITVPPGWSATAPGEQLGTDPWHYSADWPITPYLIAFYAGTYTVTQETHGGVDVNYWLHPTDWTKASATFDEIGEMLAWLESRYGAYPYPKLAWAEINLGGAVEVPSCVAIGTQVVGSTEVKKDVVVHELAHTWFQGQVTIASWDDIWLSEGMAAYHEVLWEEHKGGPEALQETAYSYGLAYRSIADLLEGYFPIYAPLQYFGYTVYKKGAHVWHSLRGILGDAGFQAMLTDYLALYSGSVAATEDLIPLIDAQPSAAMPGAQFIDEWIMQAGFPIYRVEWRPRWDGTGAEVTLSQTQTEGDTPYMIPLTLAFRGEGQETRHTVTYEDWSGAMQPGSAAADVDVPHAIEEVVVDPDRWVLHEAEIVGLPAVEPPPEPDPEPEPSPELAGPDAAPEPQPNAAPPTPVDEEGCASSTGSPSAPLGWVVLLLIVVAGNRRRRALP